MENWSLTTFVLGLNFKEPLTEECAEKILCHGFTRIKTENCCSVEIRVNPWLDLIFLCTLGELSDDEGFPATPPTDQWQLTTGIPVR